MNIPDATVRIVNTISNPRFIVTDNFTVNRSIVISIDKVDKDGIKISYLGRNNDVVKFENERERDDRYCIYVQMLTEPNI